MVLPTRLRVPPENATADVVPGEVGFAWFAAGSSYGVTDEFAEICWFYDVDARPSMHEGPAPVSVFARLTGAVGPFYARCRAMRRCGVAALLIEPDSTHRAPVGCAYHDPKCEVPLVTPDVVVDGDVLRIGQDTIEGGCRLLRRHARCAEWSLGARVGPGSQTVLGAALVRQGDGALTALVAAGTPASVSQSWSRDDGATWSVPADSGIAGSAPSAAMLADGRMACVVAADGALAAHVSADDGTTWRSAERFGVGLERPVTLPLSDGRLACAACRPGHAMPDRITILTP
jgi:hypothetical protein